MLFNLKKYIYGKKANKVYSNLLELALSKLYFFQAVAFKQLEKKKRKMQSNSRFLKAYEWKDMEKEYMQSQV